LRLNENPDQLHYEKLMAGLIQELAEENEETPNEELLMCLVS